MLTHVALKRLIMISTYSTMASLGLVLRLGNPYKSHIFLEIRHKSKITLDYHTFKNFDILKIFFGLEWKMGEKHTDIYGSLQFTVMDLRVRVLARFGLYSNISQS